MRTTLLTIVAFLAFLDPAFPQQTVQPQQPAAQETQAEQRARILEVARQYAGFRWRASGANVLHGNDADGTRVDTPDVLLDAKGWSADGRENVGIPYAWGGFSSLEDFQKGIEQGLHAGHIPKVESARSSRHAVGVDCSGFVSRCWDLPRKQSTRSLGSLCYELDSFESLLPGDIVNSFDGHVVLFEKWEDADRSRMRVFEAGRLRVEESSYEVALLKDRGYLPLRYMPLDPRWVAMDLGEPDSAALEAPAAGRWIPAEAAIAGATFADLPNPVKDAVPHEWVRYRVASSSPGVAPSIETRMVARTTETVVETQTVGWVDGKKMMSGAALSKQADMLGALLEFTGISEPMKDFQAVESRVEAGTFVSVGRRYPARKITAVLKGELEMRHTRYPLTIWVTCYQSDEVPMHGILEAEFDTEFVWGNDDKSEPVVIETKTTLHLLAIGRL